MKKVILVVLVVMLTIMGCNQSPEDVVKKYRKAAEKGDAEAQYNLGVCYYEGEGVTQDNEEAVKWFRMAAEQGHVTAGQLAALAQARERAASSGLATVTEEAIEDANTTVQDTMANIRQYVDTHWRQIEELFQEERQDEDMYGSIVVTLYFSPDGGIEGVDLDQRPGSSFTENFKGRAREIMMGWEIPTTQQMQPYQFTRRFIRN